MTLTDPILIKDLMRCNWKSWLMKYSSTNSPLDYFCLKIYRHSADVATYIWKQPNFSTYGILQIGKKRGKLVTQQTDSKIHLLS